MEQLKELVSSIESTFAQFQADAIASIEKGNKSAARRARKASRELDKLFKEFRKVSNEASKAE